MTIYVARGCYWCWSQSPLPGPLTVNNEFFRFDIDSISGEQLAKTSDIDEWWLQPEKSRRTDDWIQINCVHFLCSFHSVVISRHLWYVFVKIFCKFYTCTMLYIFIIKAPHYYYFYFITNCLLQIEFECGIEDHVTSISENEVCQYLVRFTTPAACWADQLSCRLSTHTTSVSLTKMRTCRCRPQQHCNQSFRQYSHSLTT